MFLDVSFIVYTLKRNLETFFPILHLLTMAAQYVRSYCPRIDISIPMPKEVISTAADPAMGVLVAQWVVHVSLTTVTWVRFRLRAVI